MTCKGRFQKYFLDCILSTTYKVVLDNSLFSKRFFFHIFSIKGKLSKYVIKMKTKWKFISRGMGESRLVQVSFSIHFKDDKKLSNPSSLKLFIFSNLMATSSMCSVVVDVAEMQQCRECRQRRRAGRGTRSGP